MSDPFHIIKFLKAFAFVFTQLKLIISSFFRFVKIVCKNFDIEISTFSTTLESKDLQEAVFGFRQTERSEG